MPSGANGSRSMFWAGFGSTLFVFVVGMALGFALCYWLSTSQPAAQGKAPEAALSAYIDRGGDVYEFPSVNEQFTAAVTAFLEDPSHAGLHCHLLADTYGHDGRYTQEVTGHLLQCHDNATYAQKETLE